MADYVKVKHADIFPSLSLCLEEYTHNMFAGISVYYTWNRSM